MQGPGGIGSEHVRSIILAAALAETECLPNDQAGPVQLQAREGEGGHENDVERPRRNRHQALSPIHAPK